MQLTLLVLVPTVDIEVIVHLDQNLIWMEKHLLLWVSVPPGVRPFSGKDGGLLSELAVVEV